MRNSPIDTMILICHHDVLMRTTLEVDNDVLDAARALAAARRVSIGAALSELARRGITARTPLQSRNGFAVFQVPAGTPCFGPDDVVGAIEREDFEVGREFMDSGRPSG
jgi:hypothetical protein